MRPKPPNQYRFRSRGHYCDSADTDGMNGFFSIPLQGFGHKVIANCICSDGTDKEASALDPSILGWEHVSVHVVEFGKQRTPTWAEMCAVKGIFWGEDEWVVQYHPAQSDYVNMHDHVLHLWKPPVEFPRPPKICV